MYKCSLPIPSENSPLSSGFPLTSLAKMNYPYPGSYAVAQIDLEATLSGITDQDVIEAAMKIRTTKSLVLLNMVRAQFLLPPPPCSCARSC